jgi:PAS domain S-box-containing protein
MATDITERNRAEEALRQTQIQLRHLLDSSPVAIYSLQAVPALRTTFVSENVTSFLGYEPHEFIDDAGLWRDRLHPDDVHRTLPDLARVLEHGVARLLYRFRHKDGHYVWVRDESKLVHDADGHPLEIVGVLEDVTGKVELGEQLRQAQKMEAVGQLAGGIAHDFNNLLQVISGHTEMLLGMADDTGALHARARTIRAATDRGATLTRRLLAFSRRQVLEPRVLDLNQLVAEVKAMMGPVIGEDLVLETQLAPDLPPVSIDPNQFEQALMNLLMNARDAMSGGGVVTIATAMVELVADNAHRPFDVPAGRYVAVSVRDRGPGIDDEALPHLFEPFFSTKPTGKGTGLGLASVYGVLSQSGGYVTVSSERGRGATFTALLPPAQQTVTPAHVAGAEPDAQAGRGTILVVEDEDDVRAIIRTYLESSGYVVREAASSDEALASVDSGPIALLVSDVVMPGMGGAELVSRLSARQPGLKVLLVSGNPDGDAVIDRLVQPGTAFLQKPFSRQNLIAKVHELLGEHT